MQKPSKKKSDNDANKDDLDDDALDISDLGQDESLLSLEYQELDGLDLKTDIEGGKKDEVVTKILEQTKTVPKKFKVKSTKTHAKQETPEVEEKYLKELETDYQVTELMVEELGNFGLDINTIQEIINEAKKFYDQKDFEAGEALIKNSKVFASNLWLEHRMNLISTLMSFIDTFILNQTDMELDFKNANKYFIQAQEFLKKRDLTFANKYIENTIQNVKKSCQGAQKKKLKDAIKFAKYWINELKEYDLDIANYKGIILEAQNLYKKNDYEKTEHFLRNFVESLNPQIKNLDMEMDRREDILQGIEGIYDLDNFSTLDEVISKAESMLLESQEKDKTQLQLNSLLNSYKMIKDIENQGLDTKKLHEFFTNAKESFDKGDYDSAGTLVKKIMATGRQILVPDEGAVESDKLHKIKSGRKTRQLAKPKEKQKKLDPSELTPEQKEIYDKIKTLKKDLKQLQNFEKTGEEIVKIDEMIEKAETELTQADIETVQKIVNETQDLISEVMNKVLKVKAENTIESTLEFLNEAKELNINIAKAGETLDIAKAHFDNKEFQEAIEEALKSQQIVELARETHQNASDKLLKMKLMMDKAFKNKDKAKGLKVLYNKTDQALKNNDYETVTTLSGFVISQIKLARSGKDLNIDKIDQLENLILTMDDLTTIIKDLKATGEDTFDAENILSSMEKALQKQNIKEILKLVEKGKKIIFMAKGGDELQKITESLEDLTKDLSKLETEGLDISSSDQKVSEIKQSIEDMDVENAKRLMTDLSEEISNLKSRNEINKIINNLEGDIANAKSEQVNTNEVETLINSVKEQTDTLSYEDAKEILDRSKNILEKSIASHHKENAEAEMESALETLKTIPDEHERYKELDQLLKQANESISSEDYQVALEFIIQFNKFSDEVIEQLKTESVAAESVDEPEQELPEVDEESEAPEAPEAPEVPEAPEAPEKAPEPESELEQVSEESEKPEKPLIDEIPEEIEKLLEEKDDAELETDLLEDEDFSTGSDSDMDHETGLEPQSELEFELEQEGTQIEFEPVKDKEKSPIDDEVEMTQAPDSTTDESSGEPPPSSDSDYTSKIDGTKAEQLFKEAFGFFEEAQDEVDQGRKEIPDEERSSRSQTRSRKYLKPSLDETRKEYESLRKQRDHQIKKQMEEEFGPEYEGYERPGGEPEGLSRLEKPIDDRYPPPPRPPERSGDRYARGQGPARKPNDQALYPPEYGDYPPERFGYEQDMDLVERERPPPQRRAGTKGDRFFSELDRGRDLELGSTSPRRHKRHFTERPPKRAQDARSRKQRFSAVEPKISIERSQPIEGALEGDERILDDGPVPSTVRERRLGILKKEAVRGLQDIQAIITDTAHFGAAIKQLEQLSNDARNAFDDGEFQEVLLYVDECEELSRKLKLDYMESLIPQIFKSGENTDYLEYLVHEAENAYYEERYKVGDEVCRRFMTLVKELEFESTIPHRSKLYCRYCGNAIPPDSAFCTICGEKLW
jgi:hypothetical protein